MTTEQRYRVIADRDRGDDPTWDDVQDDDLYTLRAHHRDRITPEDIVRIERPALTTNEPPEADATPDEAFELGEVSGYNKGYADGLAEHSSVPTREQIAEVLWRADLNPWTEVPWTGTPLWMVERYLNRADAVLALLNGADHD